MVCRDKKKTYSDEEEFYIQYLRKINFVLKGINVMKKSRRGKCFPFIFLLLLLSSSFNLFIVNLYAHNPIICLSINFFFFSDLHKIKMRIEIFT